LAQVNVQIFFFVNGDPGIAVNNGAIEIFFIIYGAPTDTTSTPSHTDFTHAIYCNQQESTWIQR
jgi:hypothetical protein